MHCRFNRRFRKRRIRPFDRRFRRRLSGRLGLRRFPGRFGGFFRRFLRRCFGGRVRHLDGRRLHSFCLRLGDRFRRGLRCRFDHRFGCGLRLNFDNGGFPSIRRLRNHTAAQQQAECKQQRK